MIPHISIYRLSHCCTRYIFSWAVFVMRSWPEPRESQTTNIIQERTIYFKAWSVGSYTFLAMIERNLALTNLHTLSFYTTKFKVSTLKSAFHRMLFISIVLVYRGRSVRHAAGLSCGALCRNAHPCRGNFWALAQINRRWRHGRAGSTGGGCRGRSRVRVSLYHEASWDWNKALIVNKYSELVRKVHIEQKQELLPAIYL